MALKLSTKYLSALLLSGSMPNAAVIGLLAFEPANTAIRPMGHAAIVFFVAVLWFGFGLQFCVLTWLKRKFLLGIFYLGLGLLPLPIAIAVMRAVVAWKGLILKP